MTGRTDAGQGALRTRARMLAVGVWITLMVAAAVYLIDRTTIESDFSVFLPRGTNDVQRLLVGQLRNGAASRLLLIAVDGDEPAKLARISAELTQKLTADPAFDYVNNGGSALAQRELSAIAASRYLLSDRIDEDSFSVERLRAALEQRLEDLAGSFGAIVKPLLAADPTGETLHILQRLAPDRQPRRIGDAWFNGAGTTALLIARTRAPGADLAAQASALQSLRAAFATAVAAGSNAGAASPARLRYSSPGAMAVESKAIIAGDVARLSVLSSVLILAILAFVYRSARVVVLCTIPALSGLLCGIVAVNLWFGSVHAIALGFGATLLGESVDYPSYLLTQRRLDESMRDTIVRLRPTLTLAVATTACGSLALLLAGFPGLAQLGLLTATGVVVAGLVTVFVLPAFVSPEWCTPFSAASTTAVRIPARFDRVRRIATVLLVALALTPLLLQHRWWDDDIAHMNPLPAQLLRDDRQLREALGAPEVGSMLVIDAATRDDALMAAERLRTTLQSWRDTGTIGGFMLVSDYLPSLQTQMQRQAALPEPLRLRANLERALQGLPFRSGTFEPFLRDVEQARVGPLLTADSLDRGSLGLRTAALLRQVGDRWSIAVPVAGVADPATMRSRVTTLADPQVRWIDIRAETSSMLATYRRKTLAYTGVGLVLIYAVLAAGLKSWIQALRVLSPVVGALVLVAGTLVAAGEPISIFHLVALLLTLGIGVNYALFVVGDAGHGTREEARGGEDADSGGPDRGTIKTLAVVVGTTLCAFGALTLSQTPVLHAIGATVCLGVVYSLLLIVLSTWPSDAEPAARMSDAAASEAAS